MSKNAAVLSQEDFIRKLGKDISLYPNDLDKIRKHWDVIAATAAKLLPDVPDIGILSMQKRLQAYRYIEKCLDELSRQGEIEKDIKGEVLLLMSYSSSTFRKAFDADERVGFIYLDLLKINTRQLWINLPLALLLIFAIEYKINTFEKLHDYYLYYPEQQAQGLITQSRPDGKQYRLAYTYQVENETYEGKWISFEAHIDNKYTMRVYPAGKEVKVYYNLHKPSSAVLERKRPDWLLYMLASFTLVLSYMMLTISWGRDDSYNYKRPPF